MLRGRGLSASVLEKGIPERQTDEDLFLCPPDFFDVCGACIRNCGRQRANERRDSRLASTVLGDGHHRHLFAGRSVDGRLRRQ